jgi:hypothetical protein
MDNIYLISIIPTSQKCTRVRIGTKQIEIILQEWRISAVIPPGHCEE